MFCLILLLTVVSSQDIAYVQFNDSCSVTSSICGNVTVSDGKINLWLNLDAGRINNPSLFTENCLNSGLFFHIHQFWTNNESLYEIGSSDCGSARTGGHYDPWLGCGAATGNDYCTSKGGCVPGSSSSNSGGYICNTTTFNISPYYCELGDWSGKYGKLTRINHNYTYYGSFSSFYELDVNTLNGKSLVFHCGDSGIRLFCGKFVVISSSNEVRPNQPNEGQLIVDFNDAFKSFNGFNDSKNEIKLLSDGSYTIDFSIPHSANLSCNASYYVFTQWNSIKDSLYGNSECSIATSRKSWDPTVSCLPMSGNSLCGDSGTCPSNGSYSCDYSNDRYSCAPGDLSGKWGRIYLKDGESIFLTGSDYTIPALDLISRMSIGLVCDNDIIFCGRLQDMSVGVATATFGGSDYTNITGTVTVSNNELNINLDISHQELPVGCATGGLKYHIHNSWSHSDSMSRFGSNCGGGFTGNHYDPYSACGAASGNSYCNTCNLRDSYDCNSITFLSDPFSCEIGDLSGKYGVLSLDANNTLSLTGSSQYLEVRAGDLTGKSIVFHCSDGSRIFCAPFEVSGIDGNDIIASSVNTSDSITYYYASFDNISNDNEANYIQFGSDGSYEITLNLNKSSECISNQFTLSLYQSWNGPNSVEKGISCNSYVNDGLIYDPGFSCPPQAFNVTNECLCMTNNSYSYACDYGNDRFSCASGDLSGKYGIIIASMRYNAKGYDYTLPPFMSVNLGNMAAVIQCNENGYNYVACTAFNEGTYEDSQLTDNPTNNPTNDPSKYPTTTPSTNPTNNPTSTKNPSNNPTNNPTFFPSNYPSYNPTINPTQFPTDIPTQNPTTDPTPFPTINPSNNPTQFPTNYPSNNPTSFPSNNPTGNPTQFPTDIPTQNPTKIPIDDPSSNPTTNPTKQSNAPYFWKLEYKQQILYLIFIGIYVLIF